MQDADPFVSQPPDGRLVRPALGALLIVVGFCQNDRVIVWPAHSMKACLRKVGQLQRQCIQCMLPPHSVTGVIHLQVETVESLFRSIHGLSPAERRYLKMPWWLLGG